jgi:hypothetical protein
MMRKKKSKDELPLSLGRKRKCRLMLASRNRVPTIHAIIAVKLSLCSLNEAREELFEGENIVIFCMLDEFHNARFACAKIAELSL